jgi:hypothetical protein
MDTKLEVVVLTVSSTEGAEQFYRARGVKR